jgi:ABC-2 type transport system permease protein
MNSLAIAFVVEAKKAVAARVMVATTLLLVLGVGAMSAGLTAAAARGNEQVLAKLGPQASIGGWDGLAGAVTQITAAAGVLAFGVALSWMIGREFADATVTGLFALPVSRTTIVTAKLLVYLLWTVGVAVLLVLVVALVGLVMRVGGPSTDVAGSLVRLLALTILSGLVAVPAAWAATIGRGILPGVATTIGIIAIAQIMAVSATGAWFPFTAPALWAIYPGAVTAVQLSLVPTVPIAFGLLTRHSWRRLQLDR